jgi:hypothetical protein
LRVVKLSKRDRSLAGGYPVTAGALVEARHEPVRL